MVDTVRLWRRRKGWTQTDLAREAGVHLETISGIESGRHEPRPSTLQKLAHAFGVEVEELFDGPKAEAPTSPALHRDGEERRSVVAQDSYERLMDQYEPIRHQIRLFDELSPGGRKELFDRTWSLRERVYGAQDNHPKREVALLHDALTHAVLFFIEVFYRERGQSPGEAVPGEQLGGTEGVASLDDFRQRIRVS